MEISNIIVSCLMFSISPLVYVVYSQYKDIVKKNKLIEFQDSLIKSLMKDAKV